MRARPSVSRVRAKTPAFRRSASWVHSRRTGNEVASSVKAMAKSFTNDPALIAAAPTRFNLLGALSFSHFLNDMMQSLIVAIYPLLKGEFHLSFAQIGAITLTYQICASLLQPLIGSYTDKHPKPYSLSVGMCFTLIVIVMLAFAPRYGIELAAAA